MPSRVNILSTPSAGTEAAALRNANDSRRLDAAVRAADKIVFPPRWR